MKPTLPVWLLRPSINNYLLTSAACTILCMLPVTLLVQPFVGTGAVNLESNAASLAVLTTHFNCNHLHPSAGAASNAFSTPIRGTGVDYLKAIAACIAI